MVVASNFQEGNNAIQVDGSIFHSSKVDQSRGVERAPLMASEWFHGFVLA